MKAEQAEVLIREVFDAGLLRPVSNEFIAYNSDGQICGCAVSALAIKLGFEMDAIFEASEVHSINDLIADLAKRAKLKEQNIADLIDGFDATGDGWKPEGIYSRQRKRAFFQLGQRLRAHYAPKTWRQR